MKKSLQILSLLIMMMCVAMPSMAKDNKKSETVVFTVTPGMSCENCENKIKSNLRFEKGIKDIQTNLKEQTVTVTFNPEKTTTENIAAAFKKIGYEATTGAAKKCSGSHKGCSGHGDKAHKGCGKNGGNCAGCKNHKK